MAFNMVKDMEQAFTMQSEFIKGIKKLIDYDKTHSEQPENTKLLEGFCETQEKALDKALLLLQKHKNELLAEEEREQKKHMHDTKPIIRIENTDIPKNDAEQECLFGDEDV